MSGMGVFEVMEIIRSMQDVVRKPAYREQRNAALAQARAAGWSLDDIARTVGLSREHIRHILKQRGAR